MPQQQFQNNSYVNVAYSSRAEARAWDGYAHAPELKARPLSTALKGPAKKTPFGSTFAILCTINRMEAAWCPLSDSVLWIGGDLVEHEGFYNKASREIDPSAIAPRSSYFLSPRPHGIYQVQHILLRGINRLFLPLFPYFPRRVDFTFNELSPVSCRC